MKIVFENKQTQHLVLLAIAFCFCGTTAEAAVINIRKQVTVKAGFVKLKDVATIQEDDEKLRRRLEEIVLTPVPAAGRNTRLRFDNIRSRLIALGFDMSKIEFRGSSSVTVHGFGNSNQNILMTSAQLRLRDNRQRKVVAQAEEKTQREIASYLSRIAPELGIVKIEMNLQPHDISKILMPQAPGWDISGGAAPWESPQSLRIRFIDENDIVQSLKITVRVSPQPAMVVARFDIPRGRILRSEDLKLLQIANSRDGIARIDLVVGRETVKTLRRDKPIQQNDIKKVPLIRRGDTVTVVSQYGGIRAERHMVAKDEGGMGDVIVLSTTDRKNQVFATITGLRTAVVSAPRQKQYDTQVQPAGGLTIQYADGSRSLKSSRRGASSRRVPATEPPRIVLPYGVKRIRR